MAPLRICRAVNNGPTPFKDACDSQVYLIPSQSESLIPYEAAVLWFGNPDTIDIDARRRDRTDEYMRIRVRYGIYEHEDRLGQMPQVEIFTLEGDKINMVKDDPEGILNNPIVSDDSTLRSVQQQLLVMQAQQQQLLDAISKDPAAAAAIMQALKGEEATVITDEAPVLTPTITDGDPGNIPESVSLNSQVTVPVHEPVNATPPPTPTVPRSDAPPVDAPAKIKVS